MHGTSVRDRQPNEFTDARHAHTHASNRGISCRLVRAGAVRAVGPGPHPRMQAHEPKMAELATHLGLDRSSVSGLIYRAVRHRPVRRDASSDDGRTVRVRLTPDGRRLADLLTDEIGGLVAPMTGKLSPAGDIRQGTIFGNDSAGPVAGLITCDGHFHTVDAHVPGANGPYTAGSANVQALVQLFDANEGSDVELEDSAVVRLRP